ncbi:MAG TPA: HAD-IC family P-type ATPase, partial [Bacteroidia bacterium]|nr:HAD-IC family P-type ATPase [Bacteroidia bacterium]
MEDLPEQKGLNESEAKQLQVKFGFNELPSAAPKSIWKIIVGVLKEPMFILLVGCGALYFVLGDPREGIMLFSSVTIIIAITFYQEKKTERALEALRDLSSPRALVIREGVTKRIAGREVVPGDVLILREGDRVAADAVVLLQTNLVTDESLLTGESVPVRKSNWDRKQEFGPPQGEDIPFVYSGTLIVRGNGLARVVKTGTSTFIGKIGRSLKETQDEPALLKAETRKIIRIFTITGFSLSATLVLVFGFIRHDWMGGVLEGISLAMAMLPEEFAVVLTIFMALGAWRMSRRNVLTRNPASIETLGSVTVLCADKTGTLTENRMKVKKMFADGKMWDDENGNGQAAQVFTELLHVARLASQQTVFDPMERAIADAQLQDGKSGAGDEGFVREYELSPALFAMTRVYRAAGKESFFAAAKGAPEAILSLCRVNAEERENILAQVNGFAKQGLRVLAVARAEWKEKELPHAQKDFLFRFCGLLGFEDPLRKGVRENLQMCYDAGIRVIMITGDYPETAMHVAEKMGLKNADRVITGAAMEKMSDAQLGEDVRSVNVFARVVPEQKLRLVNALKANGEIVGMTGDGVNDAPALKSAHIGIAMGQRGTDVAREAADIVLLNDDFDSVIEAVRTGRSIYENIRKAMGYVFAVHIPIAGLAMLPVLFPSFPMILFPLHIAFLELIIDPASSLIFEAEP